MGHDNNRCYTLKDDIKELIQKGKLSQYVKKDNEKQEPKTSPHKGKTVISGGFPDEGMETMKTMKRR